jgi:hypothetical protein
MNSAYCAFFLQVVSLLLVNTSAQQGVRQDPCHVCRRSDRFVTNPNKSFQLTDIFGKTFSWTCGELEENALTVKVSNTVCGIFMAHARDECECGGPPIAPEGVLNENPACDICIDGRAVPELKKLELVNTGIAGQMPCGFLYTTAADGGMPARICPIIQENVNEFCCTDVSVAPFDPDDSNFGGDDDPVPTCGDLHTDCEDDCCSPYECKTRVIGQPRTCSVSSSKIRTSVAGRTRGGAGGLAKYTN